MSKAHSGMKCSGSSASSDRVGYLLKMSLRSVLAALTSSSVSWSQKATPAGRSWYRLKTSAIGTGERESGSWPTATATDSKDRPYSNNPNGTVSLHLLGAARDKWATPTASAYGYNQGGAAGRVGKKRFSVEGQAREARWAAPQAHNAQGTPGALSRATGSRQADLATQALGNWPSPAARDYKDSGQEPAARSRKSPCLPSSVALSQEGSQTSTSGKHQDSLSSRDYTLNPEWVSQLMGLPDGWVDVDENLFERLDQAIRRSRRFSSAQP